MSTFATPTEATRLAPGVSTSNPPTHIDVVFERVLGAYSASDRFELDTRTEEDDWWDALQGSEVDDGEQRISGDLAEEVFDALVVIIRENGGIAEWKYLDAGDVYVLAYGDADGIALDSTYGEEGSVRLSEIPFLVRWTWSRPAAEPNSPLAPSAITP